MLEKNGRLHGPMLLQRAGHSYFGVVSSSLGHFLGDYYVKMDLHISVAAEQQKDLCGHPLLHSYFGIPQTA